MSSQGIPGIHSQGVAASPCLGCLCRQFAVGAELVHAFCIGYYGASQTQTFSEASGAGADYLAEVCRAWEAEALRSPTRTVIIRTGAHLAF